MFDFFKYVIELVVVLLLVFGIKGFFKVCFVWGVNQLVVVVMGFVVFGLLFNYFGISGISIVVWIWIIVGMLVGGVFGVIIV